MNEPKRMSYLDVVKANMKAAGRTEFITRLVYFGEYHGTDDDLHKNFLAVIDNLRSCFPETPLTGLLLIHPQYFIHIIETSEELLFRHFKAIFHCKETAIDLGRVLLLPPYHHVYHHYFPKWHKLTAKAPQLLEKLEGNSTEYIEQQMTNCLSKIYTLCEHVSKIGGSSTKTVDEAIEDLRDKDQNYLPESTLIEFLLKSKSPMLRDCREYIDIAATVPQITLYNENIWPPPSDFMPHDVLDEGSEHCEMLLKRITRQLQREDLL